MADDDVVSVRELKANLADYLRRVRDGEVIHISRHGWPCADLGPVDVSKKVDPT